jgi:hypothetical protein
LCECVIWFGKHEWARSMERALWWRRFEEEESTELLHVRARIKSKLEPPPHCTVAILPLGNSILATTCPAKTSWVFPPLPSGAAAGLQPPSHVIRIVHRVWVTYQLLFVLPS